MSDDEVDQLYAGAPEDFTALRTKLVAAAKKRGDADAAKRIGAARRPTTAAWVVNVLVRTDATARDWLTDLGEQLRAAHTSMDGPRIRELSAVQRKVIDALARAGFAAAGVSKPSAAMRDDVVGTLQAAVADPEVAARLGRLSVCERWSGFGEFGAVSSVGAPRIQATSKPSAAQHDPGPTEDQVAAATERVAAARSELDAAERAHSAAVDTLRDRQSHLSTARRRYETLLERLSAAERELGVADDEHAAAEQVVGAAADSMEKATARLAELETDLAALGGAEPRGVGK